MTGYPLRVEFAARAGMSVVGTVLGLVVAPPTVIDAVIGLAIAVFAAVGIYRLVLRPYLLDVTDRPAWDPHARADATGAAVRGALIPALVVSLAGAGFPFMTGVLLGDAVAASLANRGVRRWEAGADARLLRLGGRLWEDVWFPGSMLWVGNAPHGTVLANGERPPAA